MNDKTWARARARPTRDRARVALTAANARGRGTRAVATNAFAMHDVHAMTYVDAIRDVAALVIVSASAVAWVRAFDVAAREKMIASTLSRKLAHITSGTLFCATWPLFSASADARALACVIPLAQGMRLFAYGVGFATNANAVNAVSRGGGREELLKGPLYYTIVLFVCCAIFWRATPIGVVAVAMMCGGDGFADILGRKFGRGNPLPWNPTKSFAGSAGFVCGGFAVAGALLAYYDALGMFDVDAATYATTFFIACACALVESLPVTDIVDDNFSVALTAIAIGMVMYA